MPVTTDLDKFRLELGDHPTPDMPEGTYVYLLNNDEASYFLSLHPTSVLRAVADACDALARRFAREFDFDTTSEKSFKRSQKSEAYRKMATELRARAKLEDGGGLGVIVTTRADGYSDDLNTRETRGLVGASGRAQLLVYDEDVYP